MGVGVGRTSLSACYIIYSFLLPTISSVRHVFELKGCAKKKKEFHYEETFLIINLLTRSDLPPSFIHFYKTVLAHSISKARRPQRM